MLCGNGVIEKSEECDDGNLINGDGCNHFCFLEPHCTFNNTDPDSPPHINCTSHCGNGIIEADLLEECDDGNNINGDGCD